MNLASQAADVLKAVAASDLAAVRRFVAENVLLYGTDEGERWTGRDSFLAALDGMRDLGLSASWEEPPVVGDGWVAGVACYRSRHGRSMRVRVTLVFAEGLLVHGHYSVEAPTPGPA